MRNIIAIDVFTHDECASITEEVLKLDDFLVDRDTFWTLGAATYQDDPKAYPAIANAFNVINRAAFGRMHDAINQKLSDSFDKPVGHFSRGVGLPSFHLFDHTSNGVKGHPHIDEPYTRIDLTGIEWDTPFTFTLPVAIPTAGAGIDFWWDATDKEVEAYMAEDTLPEPDFVPYELGKLYVHDGKTPHRIASVAPIPEGEIRLTLQGHGIHVTDGILVYF